MQYHVQRIVDHLYGPTGSVILHILIVIALIKFVSFATREQQAEVEVMIMEPEAVDLEEIKELEKELEEMEQPEIDVDVEVYQDVPAPEDVEFDSAESDVDFDALDVVTDVSSPLVMKGLFQGRSASGRAGMLRSYGGRWGQAGEAAVVKALEWLKNHQEADGRWEKTPVAMTGLALLTYLAHGETPSSEKYGATVEKAMRYLLSQQKEDGFIGNYSQGGAPIYAHAIATYALSEAYGMTRIPMLKPAMEKGIERIIQGQQAGGGWDYGYKKGERRDTSVVGWQVQALKAAHLAGANNPKLADSKRKAIEDLKSVYNPERGSFGYTGKQGRNDSMTGVGTLCLQLLGYANASEAEGGVNALKPVTCEWDNAIHGGLYAWYYITQVMFHKGGSIWQGWNNKFARTLITHQASDGHWDFPKYHNGDSEHGANNGPVYSTTLSALMLQVYYRHLPTFKEVAVEEEEDAADEDDVIVEII